MCAEHKERISTHELSWLSHQRRSGRKYGRPTAGVEKDDRLVRIEFSSADVADQAGHGFARVDRVEEDGLGSRQETDRFRSLLGGNTVGGADERTVDHDVSGGELPTDPEQLSRAIGQSDPVGDELVDRMLDGDTVDGERRRERLRPNDESGLRPQ
jgi:hypothetical protein